MNSRRLSCVIPARNESGHLREVVGHVLSLPEIQDIILVEGGSTDDTYVVAKEIATLDPKRIRALKQSGKGKFDAVLEGAAICRESLIIIWDADGTVPLQATKEVINRALETNNPCMGDRLRGVIEAGAMQRANWIGNWVFAILWSPILKSKPRDMLCGTKVFPRIVFEEIPDWLVAKDPYGDFALVATARSLGYRIESVVVDYRARTYGETNIHRWSGGLHLLRATLATYLWTFRKYRGVNS